MTGPSHTSGANGNATRHLVGQSKLSKFERLTLLGGTDLEKAIEWLANRIRTFTLHERLGEFDPAILINAVSFYDDPLRSVLAQGFFVAPSRTPLVTKRAVHAMRDGFVHDLSFTSAYECHYEPYSEEYNSFEENRTVHARYWQHDREQQEAKGTIIGVHGWTMGDQRINSLAFQPGFFYREGYDLVLVELPFHGRRIRAKGKAASAVVPSMFPSTHFIRTNEALCQAISDLRELRLYLQHDGAPSIGVMGMSLGGYVSSLWTTLDSLEFCIPIVPMADMAELAWQVAQQSNRASDLLAAGLELALLKRVYGFHSPLIRQPCCPIENVLIVAGLGDTIVPASQPTALWERWGHPEMYWYKGGHLAEFRKSEAFQKILRFLNGLESSGG